MLDELNRWADDEVKPKVENLYRVGNDTSYWFWRVVLGFFVAMALRAGGVTFVLPAICLSLLVGYSMRRKMISYKGHVTQIIIGVCINMFFGGFGDSTLIGTFVIVAIASGVGYWFAGIEPSLSGSTITDKDNDKEDWMVPSKYL